MTNPEQMFGMPSIERGHPEQQKTEQEMVKMWVEFSVRNKSGEITRFSSEVKATPDETWENIRKECLERVLYTTYPPEQGWRDHDVKLLDQPEAEIEKPKKERPLRRRVFE